MSRDRWRMDPDRDRQFREDRRGVTPVVAKTLSIALVVLYVGVVTTGLYTGVVPDYRDTAGDRVGDRTLAAAGGWVEDSVPSTSTETDRTIEIERRVRIDLPATIRGERYRIRTDGEALVLDHPREAVGGRLGLSLPPSVVSVGGGWSSTEPTVIAVDGSSDGLTVRLVQE